MIARVDVGYQSAIEVHPSQQQVDSRGQSNGPQEGGRFNHPIEAVLEDLAYSSPFRGPCLEGRIPFSGTFLAFSNSTHT